jgi:hypothetical protein
VCPESFGACVFRGHVGQAGIPEKGLEKIVPQAFHQSNEWLPTGVLDLRLIDREGA